LETPLGLVVSEESLHQNHELLRTPCFYAIG
jgi:hypothetical protein